MWCLTIVSIALMIGVPCAEGYLRWKDAEWVRLDLESTDMCLCDNRQRSIDRAEDLHRYYTGQGHWGTAGRDSRLRK
jgi:hypothetical protein